MITKPLNYAGLLFISLGCLSPVAADITDFKPEKALTKEQKEAKLADRKKESVELSKEQDELSADVQELIEDQTNPKVIEMLEEVEQLMLGVTDNLSEADTGKDTLFNETKIIEKIFEAAKEKSK